jgi:putative Mg2+ transporter-C (MgtC) family protein
MTFHSTIDALVRLAAAVIVGGALGFERHLHGRWAGMRTHMTVALASAVFVMGIDSPGSNAETARVIQGIAAGIGFLGAGTILKLSDRLEIKGLTTAGSIWLTAALGTVVGLGRYSIAIAGTLIGLAILAVLRPLDKHMPQGAEVIGEP